MACDSTERFEFFDDAADDQESFVPLGFGENERLAQTFTPSTAHEISHVRVNACRAAGSGTLELAIYATDGAGKPTGAALTSGTIDYSTIPSCATPAFFQVDMAEGTELESGVLYAIVLALTGPFSIGNWGRVVAGGYDDGKGWRWDGADWDDQSAGGGDIGDFLFEEHGCEIALAEVAAPGLVEYGQVRSDIGNPSLYGATVVRS